MSSLRHIVERRVHKERSQPKNRKAKFGLLEKHKDYALRAKHYNEKKKSIHKLREKARLRNAEEFSFKMVKAQLDERGRYKELENEETLEESLKKNLVNRNFIELKRSAEYKAIEKSKETFHISHREQVKKKNHILFVEDEDDKIIEDKNVPSLSFQLAKSSLKENFKLSKIKAVEKSIQMVENLAEQYERFAKIKKHTGKLSKVLNEFELQKHLAITPKEDILLIKKGDKITYKFKSKRKR